MTRAEVLHLTGPVLAGRDDVRPQAWVVGGQITYDRPAGDTVAVDGVVIPGLVDAHCHIGLGTHGAVSADEAEQQARADRDSGALLLRDAGSPSDTRWVDNRADLPKLIRAGRHIARTRRYLRDFADEVEPAGLVAAVRAQAVAGDGWVKLVGDWIDRDTGDLEACWPADVLVAAIAAAHELGARVTAHCFASVSLPDLVAAGIDCIEHGTGLDAETVPLVAAAGVAVVPTLVNIETFPQIADAAERFPLYAAHMRDLHARRFDTVRAAHEAGIPLYAGTDAGGSLAHGLVGQEVALMVRAGLDPLDALDAATWSARRWLGHPVLDEGDPADLLVLDSDPRRDPAALLSARHVVLRGVRT